MAQGYLGLALSIVWWSAKALLENIARPEGVVFARHHRQRFPRLRPTPIANRVGFTNRCALSSGVKHMTPSPDTFIRRPF